MKYSLNVYLLAILSMFMLFGCQISEEPWEEPLAECKDPVGTYAFYVAGHVYGSPSASYIGLFPPFKERIDIIQETPGMEFGVFTGDITRNGSHSTWDALEADV